MFDLVGEVLRATRLPRFTYIPMLTRDDDADRVLRTDLGTARAGTGNEVLREFLEACYRDGKRSIYETEGLFGLPGFNRVAYSIHRPRFQDPVRMQYFLSVPGEDLVDALVLVDPDEGLVGPGRSGERYLRYDEVRYLYEAMDPRSVLACFHRLPDKGRTGALMAVEQALKEWVTHGRAVISISDRRETLLFLTRDNTRHREVEDMVRAYEEGYALKIEDD